VLGEKAQPCPAEIMGLFLSRFPLFVSSITSFYLRFSQPPEDLSTYKGLNLFIGKSLNLKKQNEFTNLRIHFV